MRAVQPWALSCLSTSACLSTSSCTRGSCSHDPAASISGVAPSPLTRFTWLGSSSAISLTSWKFPAKEAEVLVIWAWHCRMIYPVASQNKCAELASVLGGCASQGLQKMSQGSPRSPILQSMRDGGKHTNSFTERKACYCCLKRRVMMRAMHMQEREPKVSPKR